MTAILDFLIIILLSDREPNASDRSSVTTWNHRLRHQRHVTQDNYQNVLVCYAKTWRSLDNTSSNFFLIQPGKCWDWFRAKVRSFTTLSFWIVLMTSPPNTDLPTDHQYHPGTVSVVFPNSETSRCLGLHLCTGSWNLVFDNLLFLWWYFCHRLLSLSCDGL